MSLGKSQGLCCHAPDSEGHILTWASRSVTSSSEKQGDIVQQTERCEIKVRFGPLGCQGTKLI